MEADRFSELIPCKNKACKGHCIPPYYKFCPYCGNSNPNYQDKGGEKQCNEDDHLTLRELVKKTFADRPYCPNCRKNLKETP